MERLCALYGYRRDPDAGLRGHRALRAHVGRGLGRRAEGDVHVHRPLRPLADAAAGGDGADLPRLRRARPAPRAAAAEALHDRADVPLRARPAAAATASTGSSRSRRSARTTRRSTPRSSSSTTRCCAASASREYRLELNSIGCRECRPAYLERLRAWLAEHDDRARRGRRARRRATSPLRVLRQLRSQAAARQAAARDGAEDRRVALRGLPSSTSPPCAPTSTRPASRYELVPTLVRGLDYYSRTTWEFVGPMENENSTISGGGRYDDLVEEIGGPPTPGVGFGAGIERLLLAMEDEGVATAEPRRRSTSSSPSSRTRRASSSRRCSRDLRDARHRRRHRLRRPLAQGPADPGRPLRRARRPCRSAPTTRSSAARASRTNRSRTPTFSADCRDDVWRDPHVRRARARSSSARG